MNFLGTLLIIVMIAGGLFTIYKVWPSIKDAYFPKKKKK